MSLAIFFMVRGRPGRFREYVHFSAISRQCQRRIVSGVTIVATPTQESSSQPMPFRREPAALVIV